MNSMSTGIWKIDPIKISGICHLPCVSRGRSTHGFAGKAASFQGGNPDSHFSQVLLLGDSLGLSIDSQIILFLHTILSMDVRRASELIKFIADFQLRMAKL